jgi:hypothetical protein
MFELLCRFPGNAVGVKFGQDAAATPAAAEPAKVSSLLNQIYLFSKKLLFVKICVH